MLKTIQTCDRDGTTREIGRNENEEKGGWRKIDNLTICPSCVKALVAWIEAGGDTCPTHGQGCQSFESEKREELRERLIRNIGKQVVAQKNGAQDLIVGTLLWVAKPGSHAIISYTFAGALGVRTGETAVPQTSVQVMENDE
jgi:hypothetical protein